MYKRVLEGIGGAGDRNRNMHRSVRASVKRVSSGKRGKIKVAALLRQRPVLQSGKKKSANPNFESGYLPVGWRSST